MCDAQIKSWRWALQLSRKKKNVATIHAVMNTETGCVYPCFFFYFNGISKEVFHVLKSAWF
jgi:hypothetical protein